MRLSFAAVEVGDSLQRGLDNLIGFLPNLIGFLIILAIGYVIARVVKGLVTKLLEKIGTDRAIHSGSTGEYVNRVAPGFRPSSVIGTVTFWFLFLGSSRSPSRSSGSPRLTTSLRRSSRTCPTLLWPADFVVAIALAGFVGTALERAMGARRPARWSARWRRS